MTLDYRRRRNRRAIGRRVDRGFTLIELAVVIMIIALLVGSILVPLAVQVEQRRITDTQKSMDEIRAALLGFAAINGRLPCPDTDGDGLENARGAGDAATDGCAGGTYVGFLPFATLGSASVDAWGDRFKYRVSNEFTRRNGDPSAATCGTSGSDPNTCTLQLVDSGNLTVSSRNANTKAVYNLANNVPAVIISFGKNGYGATKDTGLALPAPPAADVDETANAAAASTTFFSRPLTPEANPCDDTTGATPFCEFDDLVIWISTNTLFDRMVAAGTLP